MMLFSMGISMAGMVIHYSKLGKYNRQSTISELQWTIIRRMKELGRRIWVLLWSGRGNMLRQLLRRTGHLNSIKRIQGETSTWLRVTLIWVWMKRQSHIIAKQFYSTVSSLTIFTTLGRSTLKQVSFIKRMRCIRERLNCSRETLILFGLLECWA